MAIAVSAATTVNHPLEPLNTLDPPDRIFAYDLLLPIRATSPEARGTGLSAAPPLISRQVRHIQPRSCPRGQHFLVAGQLGPA